jgi:hypothetical protein
VRRRDTDAQAVIGAGEEQCHTQAEVGDAVAKAPRHALDEAVQAQAAQLIGGGARGDRVRTASGQSRKVVAQVDRAEAVRELPEQDESLQERAGVYHERKASMPTCIMAAAGSVAACGDLSQMSDADREIFNVASRGIRNGGTTVADHAEREARWIVQQHAAAIQEVAALIEERGKVYGYEIIAACGAARRQAVARAGATEEIATAG